MNDEPTLALSYAELGQRLGIQAASAKRLVRRNRWRRLAGNNGVARVMVPLAWLAERDRGGDSTGDDPGARPADGPGDSPGDAAIGAKDSPGDDPADSAGDNPGDGPALRTIAGLVEQLARATRQLDAMQTVLDASRADADTMRDERDAARLIASEVEALRATLALVQAERDRWHREATRFSLLARLFGRRAA